MRSGRTYTQTFGMKRSANEKAIKTFIVEKRLSQRQHSQLEIFDKSRDAEIRRLNSMTSRLKSELDSYNKHMSSVGDYFSTEAQKDIENDIIFPLVRTKTDWEPRQCCIGKAAVNEDRCYHFPCRNFTSYHFIFRPLPKFILDRADGSGRKSKEVRKPNVTSLRQRNFRHDGEGIKLPLIEMTERMTVKERMLKTMIKMKKQKNKIENKPTDRSVNYGKPTSLRRLKKPARPVVRDLDIK